MILNLLAGSSGQSILIALHQFYHLSWLRPVQPVTAAILPPLAYLAFVSSTRRRLLWHCDLWHALPVGFVLFLRAAILAGLRYGDPCNFPDLRQRFVAQLKSG